MKNYPLYSHPNLTSFRQLLDWNAGNTPTDMAFQYREGKDVVSVTYAQFRDDVEALASFFLHSGFREAKIAVIGENSYPWIVTYFAAVLSGNIIVPLDKELPDEDIAALLTRCGAAALIHSHAYADTAEKMLHTGCVETILDMREIPARVAAAGAVAPPVDTDPDAVCALLFTSGTTGVPKGVMLTQRSLVTDAVASARSVGVYGPTLLTLPIHHAFSFTVCVLAEMVCGLPVFISKSLRHFQEAMRTAQPQHIFVVPLYVETLYKNIWKNAREQRKDSALKFLLAVNNGLRKVGVDLRRKLFRSILTQLGGKLDLIISGGAPLKQSYIDALEAFGIQVLNGYGITECSPVVAVNRNQYYRPGSVGQVLPCCEVAIREGEICVKGENVMQGYYQDEAATRAVLEDGWFRTGDMGLLDEDGFLFITGRKKNLIILSNGKNVAPEELEERLMDIDGVEEVLVYAEEGLITAEIFAQQTEGIQERVTALNRELPTYKRIQRVKFRDREFEKTTTQKIKR